LRQVPLGNAGVFRQDFSRHSATRARITDTLTERLQVFRLRDLFLLERLLIQSVEQIGFHVCHGFMHGTLQLALAEGKIIILLQRHLTSSPVFANPRLYDFLLKVGGEEERVSPKFQQKLPRMLAFFAFPAHGRYRLRASNLDEGRFKHLRCRLSWFPGCRKPEHSEQVLSCFPLASESMHR
jgi:hypothetical protein